MASSTQTHTGVPSSDDSAAVVVAGTGILWVVVCSTVVATVTVVASCVVSAGAVVCHRGRRVGRRAADGEHTRDRNARRETHGERENLSTASHGPGFVCEIAAGAHSRNANGPTIASLRSYRVPDFASVVHDGADSRHREARTEMAKALRIGGFVAGAILIVFGVIVIALAINGGSTVRAA